MGWFLFEAMLALGVMLGAVWWTFRTRRRDEAGTDDPEDEG